MTDHSATPHEKYLTWANRTVGLAGKDVLEIGGCSPISQIRLLAPKTWICFNLDRTAVEAFNHDARQQHCPNFSAVAQDAATIDIASRFSVAYSINAFEHIGDLRTTLHKVRQSLTPGGVLFTVFGPIWSADVGHHLSIPTDRGPIGIFDGVLEPWEHLTSTPEQIYERIQPRWGPEIARRVIEYVFNYPDLNRLSEADYVSILRDCGLDPVLVIRRKSKLHPPAGIASRTRELLWLLKKGAPSTLERARAAIRFSLAFAATKLSAR
jgi:SAM-dependent methyltransferase